MSLRTIDNLRKIAVGKSVTYSAVRGTLRRERRALRECERNIKRHEKALDIVRGVVRAIQIKVHQSIANIVCRALETVFDEPYRFELRFVERRSRTEADLVFLRNGLEIDPMTASGGGVVDVASFALRLSALLLTRPALQRVLFLDEPFKFVSAEYLPRVAELLVTLSRELDVQIVMVTHIPDLRVGKVVSLGR